jgi:ABC-type multidrug transport system fused ATPase/permease subunit
VILDSLVIAAVGAAGAFAAALRRWWAQRLGFLVERHIRARLVRHAYRLHLGFHAEVASGVLISRTSSDRSRRPPWPHCKPGRPVSSTPP